MAPQALPPHGRETGELRRGGLRLTLEGSRCGMQTARNGLRGRGGRGGLSFGRAAGGGGGGEENCNTQRRQAVDIAEPHVPAGEEREVSDS
ncbi:hypothetical protein LZ31DRAFT_561605 [Colletotrichum somersetense]|nr:hypothetical protein LZ31DRAFT_561605 [Colletotrichum somersetense]